MACQLGRYQRLTLVTQSMPATSRQDRVKLARTLRDLRERAGLGGVEAGRRAGISQSKISKIENVNLLPSVDDVARLCTVYGASAEDRSELIHLATALREEGRSRIVLAAGAPQVQRRIARMEAIEIGRAHV